MAARLRAFFKQETVLCISALCAAATMLAVPPDGAYPGYIDLRVLCLLACLMAVVAGVRRCGAFEFLAAALLRRSSGGRILGVILVLLPFFTSMLVTNDVALLTFVPFTLLLLDQIGCRDRAAMILVLQTMAANLGSMATPVGNPQNLYLYGAYNLTAGSFFAVMLPLTAISLVGLTAAAVPVLPRTLPVPDLEEAPIRSPKKLGIYLLLFALCLLTVFRILPYGIMTVVVLVTFVCFFIVSGNLGRIDAVHTVLQSLLERSTCLTAVLTSQIISNVPAAVLLSGFTDNWQPLLEGVNIGGLGTPIASLASLISLKFYFRSPGAKPGRYLGLFLLANLLGLAVLLAASALL